MKIHKILIVLFLFFMFLSCNNSKRNHEIGQSAYQIEQNNFFKDGSKSPLKPKDLKNFKGIDFFKIDSSFVVKATLQKTENDSFFEMHTTTDRKPLYKIYGVLQFNINEKSYQLNVYQSQEDLFNPIYKDILFLPFTDLTNSKETYKGGRYMDLKTYDFDANGNILLNFNNTYNPYCAYNEMYSCPIVPAENHLDVRVTAGVKDFKKD